MNLLLSARPRQDIAKLDRLGHARVRAIGVAMISNLCRSKAHQRWCHCFWTSIGIQRTGAATCPTRADRRPFEPSLNSIDANAPVRAIGRSLFGCSWTYILRPVEIRVHLDTCS